MTRRKVSPRACPYCGSPAHGNPCWYYTDMPHAASGGDPPCFDYAWADGEMARERRFGRRWFLIFCISAGILLGLIWVAHAQHNHAQRHAHYQSWTSHAGVNCCNDRDCGELPDADERASGGRLEVFIDGQWCPILPQHYLKSGNVPNAAVSHVCIVKATPSEIRRGCQRLLCYQPKPMF